MTEVFVFGSNLAGRHGKGAALYAHQHCGAVYGTGVGLSPHPGPLGYSYAIPTKDRSIQTLPLSEIEVHVHTFLDFAIQHSDLTFNVTPIGCGLAGYKPRDILPLFLSWCLDDNGTPLLPENVILPQEFLNELEKE